MTALDLAENGNAPARADALVRWSRALSVLLFLLSTAALIIQLGWQTALAQRFGGYAELLTILSVALGLGAGSIIGGLLAPTFSPRSPLLLLAAIATMNGACAYIWPVTNDGAEPMLAVAPVLASSFLIGVTLPATLGPLIRRTGSAGSAFGDCLFAVMLGAAVACLASASVLQPLFGDWATLGVAIALNAAVVIGALVAHCRSAIFVDATLPQRPPLISLRRVLLLAIVAGALAMSYVVFFARAVTYATAPSQPAFVATLAAFLLGLAAGVRRAGRHCALFSAEELMRRAARSAMAVNLIGLVALPLIAQLAWLDGAVIVVVMLLCVLIARAGGTLLPYLAELAITTDAAPAWRSALLCGAYVTGAAAGTCVTGQVLMEQLGFAAIGAGLVIAGVLYTLLLVALLDLPRWQKVVRGMTAAAVAVLALALLPSWSTNVVEKIQAKADAKPAIGLQSDRSRG
jgi:spermidine synthase